MGRRIIARYRSPASVYVYYLRKMRHYVSVQMLVAESTAYWMFYFHHLVIRSHLDPRTPMKIQHRTSIQVGLLTWTIFIRM